MNPITLETHGPLFLSPNNIQYLPAELATSVLMQNDIPRIAKDHYLLSLIDNAVQGIPTKHLLCYEDARKVGSIPFGKAHLILTSPPYWTLKQYREHDSQMGHISDYEEFLTDLDKVWKQCHDLLVPGGRLICVVGDVCLSRRNNKGRHAVMPLHSSIQEHCRLIGFDNLSPIIWHKISNASYEVGGNSSFLGKPYEPNSVIKNDIEFILMQRKSGGYRNPDSATRLLSLISEENHRKWFQQIWTGLTGASTKTHPAPYPLELAERLIRMFSFVGDVVLDPFMGTGTTTLAAAKCGRNSVGVEVDPHYFDLAKDRVNSGISRMFGDVEIKTYSGE